MHPADRFYVNSSKITHETIDGEVVIVNLASGSYYSLDGAGAGIWRCLERRASLAEIVADTAQNYDGDSEALTKAVNKLVEDLLAEGLILKGPGEDQVDSFPPKSGAPAQPAQRGRVQFVPPALHKYTDMKDLLLLDPIHDVDEAGWPTVKPDDKKEDGKA